MKKHGSADGIREAAAKRAAAAAKRAATKQQHCDTRTAELAAALSREGLDIHSDSSLCTKYVRHGPTPEWPLDAVVRRTAQMRFLHESTNYGSVLRRTRDEHHCRGQYDEKEIEQEAESKVLADVGGWPSRWPWPLPST